MKYKPIQGHDDDIDPKELEIPFENRKYGWLLRFAVSAFFGALLSVFLFLFGMCMCRYGLLLTAATLYSKAIHIFWILPLVWGVLGIFFFETMVNAAKDMIEDRFGVN